MPMIVLVEVNPKLESFVLLEAAAMVIETSIAPCNKNCRSHYRKCTHEEYYQVDNDGFDSKSFGELTIFQDGHDARETSHYSVVMEILKKIIRRR